MINRSPLSLPQRIAYGLLVLLCAYAGYLATLDESDLPPLKDGDLIFQTTWVPDVTPAIALASDSWYIHTGIIRQGDDGPLVIHAAQTVSETPLSEWIAAGMLGRFAVYRYNDLTPNKAAAVLEAAKTYYGRPYDHYFSFDNEAMYCSELEYLAFHDAGLPLGRLEKTGTLHINNRFVRGLIEQRWQHYPACLNKGYDFERCYQAIMEGKLITPASIAHDSHVTRIFSNYPW